MEKEIATLARRLTGKWQFLIPLQESSVINAEPQRRPCFSLPPIGLASTTIWNPQFAYLLLQLLKSVSWTSKPRRPIVLSEFNLSFLAQIQIFTFSRQGTKWYHGLWPKSFLNHSNDL